MTADIPQNLWSLVCGCINSYWTFHWFKLLIFFKFVAFCTEFNLFTPICFVLFMIMDFPYICDHQVGLLCWWIFIVPDVVLNLVYLAIFSGLTALMSADLVQNLWSLVCSCLISYWAFHLFPLLIFFQLVAFCTEFNLFTLICFVFFMIMDLLYICDHQVGYSAGGYSLSPRCFLTWYIYPILQDWLHWWVLILHKTYDHWSVAVLTVTEPFIYSHFWFFSNWLLSALNSICLPLFVLFSLW